MDHEITYGRAPDPRIDAVEKTAMPRNEIAGILQPALAFDHALAKIRAVNIEVNNHEFANEESGSFAYMAAT